MYEIVMYFPALHCSTCSVNLCSYMAVSAAGSAVPGQVGSLLRPVDYMFVGNGVSCNGRFCS